MVKTQSTEYPPSRKHEGIAANTIREGGLYYADKQKELLEKSKEILNRSFETPRKRKDEFKEFALRFWAVVVMVIAAGGVLAFLVEAIINFINR